MFVVLSASIIAAVSLNWDVWALPFQKDEKIAQEMMQASEHEMYLDFQRFLSGIQLF